MTAVTPGSAEVLALAQQLLDLPLHDDVHMDILERAAAALRLAAKPDEEGVREALRPFADIAKFVTETQRNTRPIIFGMDNVILQRLTIGHLRAARGALYPPRES